MGRFLSVQQVHFLIIFKDLHLHAVFALPLGVLVHLCDPLGETCGGQSVGGHKVSMHSCATITSLLFHSQARTAKQNFCTC